jgi:hypothetical protein
MSLPRSNYDPRRVCLNPFPDVNLGKHRRTAGIYLAGALVSPSQSHPIIIPSYHSQPPTQFALANWTFLDAAILSSHAHSPYSEPQIPPPVHVTFVDWIPGICSLLGMVVVNLIDKDRIMGDAGFGDSSAVWRARLFLFIGFALMAGGLAGSVVSLFSFYLSFTVLGVDSRSPPQTVLVLKYIIGGYTEQFTYYGYANVSQNVALMLSAVFLWIAQSSSSEYDYNLTL